MLAALQVGPALAGTWAERAKIAAAGHAASQHETHTAHAQTVAERMRALREAATEPLPANIDEAYLSTRSRREPLIAAHQIVRRLVRGAARDTPKLVTRVAGPSRS